MIHFILHDPKDTVAVVVVEGVKAGQKLTGWIMDDDRTMEVAAREDIPIGHKLALADMKTGDTVYKYGQDIGRVVAPIRAGEHAQVQNVNTMCC
jgi:(2R)-sulfolactate sulfo-lyase subunit alpha